jgi:hypothetical protein
MRYVPGVTRFCDVYGLAAVALKTQVPAWRNSALSIIDILEFVRLVYNEHEIERDDTEPLHTLDGILLRAPTSPPAPREVYAWGALAPAARRSSFKFQLKINTRGDMIVPVPVPVSDGIMRDPYVWATHESVVDVVRSVVRDGHYAEEVKAAPIRCLELDGVEVTDDSLSEKTLSYVFSGGLRVMISVYKFHVQVSDKDKPVPVHFERLPEGFTDETPATAENVEAIALSALKTGGIRISASAATCLYKNYMNEIMDIFSEKGTAFLRRRTLGEVFTSGNLIVVNSNPAG